MKKVIVAALLLISLHPFIQSQQGWFWQNPLPQGNGLSDLQFPDFQTGFCMSYNYIVKSSNGGSDWNIVHYSNSNTFVSLHFIDNSNGFVVSDSGAIQRTTNSGQSWQLVSNLNIPNVFKIYFIDSNTGFLLKIRNNVNNTGTTIYRTINAGMNWNISFDDSLTNYKAIQFIGYSSGYVAGSNGGFGRVLKTTNAGNNWDNIVPNMPFPNVRGVLFLNMNTGFVYGSGIYTLKTTDGCQSFAQISTGIFYNMDFVSETDGFAITGSSGLKRTTNGGLNWNSLPWLPQCPNYYMSIDFMSTNSGFAAGDFGALISTSNGGQNWSFMSTGDHCDLYDICFINSLTGYIAGDDRIKKTTNGGSNWMNLATDSVLTSDYLSIDFLNASTGVAGGYSRIKRTTNGGLNWTPINVFSVGFISSICFVDSMAGFLLGKYGNIQKTTDKGLTWNSLPSYNFNYKNSLYFLDANTGFVVGMQDYGTIFKTTNCGVTWITKSFETVWEFDDVYFLNYLTGFVSGITHTFTGAFYKTSDGGNTWVNYSNDVLNISPTSMFFVNANEGFLSSDNGSFAKTTNGGVNWSVYKTNTLNFLTDIYFADNLTGYLSGWGGTILKTTTGGLPIGIESLSTEIPKSFLLHQNYPNPFNPVTRIKFDVAAMGQRHAFDLQLKIFDVLGREIETLLNEELRQGVYEVTWDGSDYPSGVYFYQLITEKYQQSKKMILVK